ncbi:MAG: DUF502 domain-containing protein [Candidatus Omnitrophica bacterium]|nr:DUF502 domain-containing protein [Candidatus Omnitrophota bacterium]
MFRKLRNYFLTGLVVILPVVLSYVIFRLLVTKTLALIVEPISNLLIQTAQPYLPDIYFPYAVQIFKGVVFIGIIASVIIVGLAARIFVIRKIFSFVERLFLKVPMISKIYMSIKQLSNAFLGSGRIIFEKTALVEYPRRGIYSIGFVTSESKEELQAKTRADMINVFIPTTPNPTSGIFILVPAKELIYLDMSVEEALKLVVSGGKVTPDYRKEGPKDGK